MPLSIEINDYLQSAAETSFQRLFMQAKSYLVSKTVPIARRILLSLIEEMETKFQETVLTPVLSGTPITKESASLILSYSEVCLHLIDCFVEETAHQEGFFNKAKNLLNALVDSKEKKEMLGLLTEKQRQLKLEARVKVRIKGLASAIITRTVEARARDEAGVGAASAIGAGSSAGAGTEMIGVSDLTLMARSKEEAAVALICLVSASPDRKKRKATVSFNLGGEIGSPASSLFHTKKPKKKKSVICLAPKEACSDEFVEKCFTQLFGKIITELGTISKVSTKNRLVKIILTILADTFNLLKIENAKGSIDSVASCQNLQDEVCKYAYRLFEANPMLSTDEKFAFTRVFALKMSPAVRISETTMIGFLSTQLELDIFLKSLLRKCVVFGLIDESDEGINFLITYLLDCLAVLINSSNPLVNAAMDNWKTNLRQVKELLSVTIASSRGAEGVSASLAEVAGAGAGAGGAGSFFGKVPVGEMTEKGAAEERLVQAV
ncbi:MAG: hypothetical protein A3E87_07800 [Gammaproteobacteria bacterium RIFCSPHIGHO2_12_FULL_35_23]|nr:MAG: hypothetical protein A3E87_07800 [Gammaproteobacteria bacterium RIFCSPHIGHO2_12_FULL_35_23]